MSGTDFIILAAGIGSRLRPLTDNLAKGLVPVAGKPLLFHALDALAKRCSKASVNATIVIGHGGDQVERAVSERYEFVRFLRNNDYEQTNNMFSLYLALCSRDERRDVVFMNGDCVYDFAILDGILETPQTVVACDPQHPHNPESMKISVEGGRISGISKAMTSDVAFAVSCDLYRLTAVDAQTLRRRCFNAVQSGDLKIWSEVVLNESFSTGDIHATPFDVDGGRWYEIDDHKDLAAANSLFSVA